MTFFELVNAPNIRIFVRLWPNDGQELSLFRSLLKNGTQMTTKSFGKDDA